MRPPRQVGLRRIAVIGDYLPRQCGIATFTTDLCESLASQFPATEIWAVPVNDIEEGYDYPDRVRFEIMENDLRSYQRAADFLNINEVDLVSVQHEYGIYGGPAGSHLLALLRELRMPIVTTLHTVLKEPDPQQLRVFTELVELSDRVVVMANKAVEFLVDIFKVPREKIDMIHHGIPDTPFVDPNFYKDQFGVEGKEVLLTFGLLSPGKGIEYVIRALPEIVKEFPNVVYIVLGATHPHILRREGEAYRMSLQRLAAELGVEKHVLFYNQFVSTQELVEFIGAADIYLTPYLNEKQITSGTLAYTVGMGKAVISTPYWYAQELLADGRGILVPFRDSKAIAESVIWLLQNEAERHAMRKRAYLFGREMIWPKVASRYMESFRLAVEERAKRPRAFVFSTLDRRLPDLPRINLTHLKRLTDETGLLQHATYTVPNYHEGYTTDDNARALALVVLLEETTSAPSIELTNLATKYLAFLNYAFNPKTNRFRNFMSYDRRWLEDSGSDDSHGRTLWGLGVTLGRSKNRGLQGMARRLFDACLPEVLASTSPRTWAFGLIGINEYLRRFSGDRMVQQARTELVDKLIELWEKNSAPDWPWFEQRLAYANAVLPHALILSGRRGRIQKALEIGLKALEWLVEIQVTPEGHFAPIGNHGFYERGGHRARFDQQPIEAGRMVSACLEAYRATGDARWYKEAERAFHWFLGRNDLHLPLYDFTTGGCRDGLSADRVNENQGAESTVTFLYALAEMHLAQQLLPSDATEAEAGEAPSSMLQEQKV